MADKGVDGCHGDFCAKKSTTRFRAIGANPILLLCIKKHVELRIEFCNNYITNNETFIIITQITINNYIIILA